jgi:hypothetical protein
MVPAGYQHGSGIVPDGSSLVPAWFQMVPAGFQMVPAWFQHGFGMVPAWFQHGFGMVPGLFQHESSLAQPALFQRGPSKAPASRSGRVFARLYLSAPGEAR